MAAEPFTDSTLWRLKDERYGRHTWHYLTEEEAKEWPQTVADKYFLGLELDLPDLPQANTPLDVARNGLTFFEKLQLEKGDWACDYGGPMFLLPGLVVAWHVTDTHIPDAWKKDIIRYLCNRANPDDGGWGLHVEGESTVFGTAMNYTVVRLLGMDAEHPVAVRARGLLHRLGGAIGVPHWGKVWLSLIGCYDWEGMNPIPPEFWLLPNWVPLHPWRWWIHCRQVYLPMSYLYSKRYIKPLTDVTRSLRDELYVQPYESIRWYKERNNIAPGDIYHPHHPVLDIFNSVYKIWENWLLPSFLKTKSEEYVGTLVDREDENTEFVNLGPVNNPLNMMVCYVRDGPDSYGVREHRERLKDYMWVNHEGMLMNGTNGVQVWDTAFLVQAVIESGIAQDPRWHPMLKKAHEFLMDSQIPENVSDAKQQCYRHQRKGAWPFSTQTQGYTVSDCTAEGLKAVLLLQDMPEMDKIVPESRLRDAVDVMLSMQNATGGFASYELVRGYEFLEWFNAAEVFGKIMIEYDYPECTTAVVTALCHFRNRYPLYRRAEIDATVERAAAFIRRVQRPDGSWYGSWGICFTYASMFALESLHLVGESYKNSPRVRKAVTFLLDKQKDDGGWGETYKSCEKGTYHHHKISQVVNTAWALISLMHAGYPEKAPLRRGIELLKRRQQPNGEWLQESIEGVFNKNCMITYPNYKFYFPIKALGMYVERFGDDAI